MRAWTYAAALALALAPLAVVFPVRVEGHSMAPGLRNGQLAFALRAWAAGTPRRGQVWVVQGPDDPVVKRVLGLPGEVLVQRHGELWLGERRLDEPYVHWIERGDAGPWTCGTGYLLLGDNRPDSLDGRRWGPLPGSAFRGRLLGH